MYHNRTFRSASNTPNGEVSSSTLFQYKQGGNIVTATYGGGSIVRGNLIALVDEENVLDMRYHHVNDQGQLMTGECRATPEILVDGRIKLHEKWTWTSGDRSSGESTVEEVKEGAKQ